jgi:CheY-like chemotaxis protein
MSRKPIKVLLVEDSTVDAELIVLALSQHGFAVEWDQVSTAPSLQTALLEKCWDIVLADDAMPEFDGLTALAMIQAMDADLPFILVSGTIEEQVAISALEAGASNYVLKSHLHSLGTIVEQEIKSAEARRRHDPGQPFAAGDA